MVDILTLGGNLVRGARHNTSVTCTTLTHTVHNITQLRLLVGSTYMTPWHDDLLLLCSRFLMQQCNISITLTLFHHLHQLQRGAGLIQDWHPNKQQKHTIIIFTC